MTGTDPHGEDTVEAQAAQWFARLKSLPVSRETLQAFFAWQRDARHATAFAAVEQMWSTAGALGDRPALIAATEAALARKATRRALIWLPRPVVAGLAAILLVLLGSGVTYWALRPEANAYATRIGQQSAVVLEDGSKVALDTDTRVIVRFEKDERRVVLEQGQAYFTVAHDTARPFRVTAGDTQVLATGTQFDVRRDGAAVAVTLVEGRVQVAMAGAPSTALGAGQQWVVRPARAAVVRAVDPATTTAWRQGRIVLDGWTLEQALIEVNRYTARPVRLEVPRFAGARLSGTFDAGDIGSFVAATTALLPLDAARDADGSIRLVDRVSSKKAAPAT